MNNTEFDIVQTGEQVGEGLLSVTTLPTSPDVIKAGSRGGFVVLGSTSTGNGIVDQIRGAISSGDTGNVEGAVTLRVDSPKGGVHLLAVSLLNPSFIQSSVRDTLADEVSAIKDYDLAPFNDSRPLPKTTSC